MVSEPEGSAPSEPGGAGGELSLHALLPLGLVAFVYSPWLILHAFAMASRPSLRLFPMVLLGSVWLGSRACRSLGRLEPGDRWATRLLVGVAVVLLGLGCFLVSPWLATAAALVNLLAAGYAIGGRRLVTALLPAWLLLWFAAAPLNGLDFRQSPLVRQLMARTTSRLLDTLQIPHLMEGVQIDLPTHHFSVDCGEHGFDPLYSMLAWTCVFAIGARRSWIHSIFLLVAATGWVLVGNIVRTVMVVVLHGQWRSDWSEGWRHGVLGLVGLAVALGLTFSTDQIFVCLTGWLGRWSRANRRDGGVEAARLPSSSRGSGKRPEPVIEPAASAVVGAARVPSRLRASGVVSRRTAVVFGLLGFVQIGLVGPLLADAVVETFRPGTPLGRRFAALNADSLPSRLGPFRRHGFAVERRAADDPKGEDSATWHYSYAGRSVVASLDYPVLGSGELTRWFRSRGWVQLERVERRGGPAEGNFVETTFGNRALGRFGYLIFRVDDRGGRSLESGQLLADLQRGVRSWRRAWSGGGIPWREGRRERVRFSVFVESEYPLARAEQDQALAFFLRAGNLLPLSEPGNGEVGR